MLPPKIQIKVSLPELESLNKGWIDWRAPKGIYKPSLQHVGMAIIAELVPTFKAKELRPQKVYRLTLKLYQAMALHMYWKFILDLDKEKPFLPAYEKKVCYDKYLELDRHLNSI